jgi:hypothetical protein
MASERGAAKRNWGYPGSADRIGGLGIQRPGAVAPKAALAVAADAHWLRPAARLSVQRELVVAGPSATRPGSCRAARR